MENKISDQTEKVIGGWGRKLSSLFTFVLMLITVSLAIIATSEIAARENVLSMLTKKITILKSEFVEQYRNTDGITAKLSDRESNLPEGKILLKEIENYENLKESLSTFITRGSDLSTFSLRNIQYQILRYDPSTIKDLKGSIHSKYPISASVIEQSYFLISLLNSDQLLAIAVMACAAVGALIAALRGNSLMTLRALSLGIATGFVVYLAIKGGKHVFLLQMQGEMIAYNPYGSAFAGLLAGLFTEKAYQILSIIVDDFADRLRAASAGKKGGDLNT